MTQDLAAYMMQQITDRSAKVFTIIAALNALIASIEDNPMREANAIIAVVCILCISPNRD